MYYIYIITNKYHTTFYIGITRDLSKRIYQHIQKVVNGFSQKYNIDKLVYFEEYSDVHDALEREKQLKNWRRSWKMSLIRSTNPKFTDLLEEK